MNIYKGNLYEKQVKVHLQSPSQKSWLWKDIPEKELREAGLLGDWNEHRWARKNNKINSLPDIGTDILLKICYENKYILVQCKNFATTYVSPDHLSGFYAMIAHYEMNGIVYYNSELSHYLRNIKKNEKIKFEKFKYDPNKIITISDYDNDIESTELNIHKNPYYYQIDAYNKLKDSNRAILSLPCGTGKSLTSVMITKEYKNIVLISPLISHSEQFMDYYRKELNDSSYNFLLINSQSGIRDKDKIKKSISENEKNILSFTYDSVDILLDYLYLDNLIIVIDEFHNLSLNDLENPESAFYNIFYSTAKILFLSATPKFFEDVEEYNSEQIFETDTYNLSMSKAINENYICDYHIFLPDLQSKITMDDIETEISIESLNVELAIKAKFILRGMLETGSKKCIIYLRNQNEVNEMIEIINKLNEYFYMDLYVDGIISDTSYSQRYNILKNFSLFNGFSIICSVRIMDEAIDLPNCDSVFITYPSESKIRNIQRISRAIRKDSFNIHKKANVFLWCDEFSDISVFLYQLKIFDDSFVENKVSILNCNGNDGKIIERNENNKDIYDDLYDFIIGIRKFGFGIDAWKKRLNKLKEFIELNKRKPLSKSGLTYEEKSMGKWVEYQIHNYKKELEIMKLSEIRSLWDDFTKNHEDLFEENESIWFSRLKDLENFILENNRIPTQSKDESIENKKLAK